MLTRDLFAVELLTFILLYTFQKKIPLACGSLQELHTAGAAEP